MPSPVLAFYLWATLFWSSTEICLIREEKATQAESVLEYLLNDLSFEFAKYFWHICSTSANGLHEQVQRNVGCCDETSVGNEATQLDSISAHTQLTHHFEWTFLLELCEQTCCAFVCHCREFGRWKVNSLAVEKRESLRGCGGLALPLDPDFQHAVRQLGRRPSLQTITESLIKKYGTHLLVSATLGGIERARPHNSPHSHLLLIGLGFVLCCFFIFLCGVPILPSAALGTTKNTVIFFFGLVRFVSQTLKLLWFFCVQKNTNKSERTFHGFLVV